MACFICEQLERALFSDEIDVYNASRFALIEKERTAHKTVHRGTLISLVSRSTRVVAVRCRVYI